VKAQLRVALSLGLPALVAIVAAGCGGSGGSSATAASGGAGKTASSGSGGGSATVDVADNSQLGKILVDSKGLTLYTFAKDTGTTSMCSGACAKGWPPLIASGKATAGRGVSSGVLGTTKRSDGSMQVTVAGHPVYTFVEDTSAGQVTGNGSTAFGGAWNVVTPSGGKGPMGSSTASSGTAASTGSSSSSTTSSSGGYGY
jgi:predicted lipoprotein with Yx(FWY)xxD motif